ncbi:MAG: XRE family transcriptional regulator [Rhodospirillales bacterium]|nr:XRE family transcriptional regulator [Rhodospirillales bacterium]
MFFADLGFPNPERTAQGPPDPANLAALIKARGLTQAQAGEVLGIKQPHVSTLMKAIARQLLRRAIDAVFGRLSIRMWKFPSAPHHLAE